jgi:ligand-binding sensor domain-containing protein/signal transduction histidine kinase
MSCHQSRHFWRRKQYLVIVASLFALAWGASAGAENDRLAGKPVVGKNADGQLEVFRIDSDGELRHRWQKESNGDWSSWSSLGGSLLPGMAIATNASGQMQVFAVDRVSNTLRYIRQKSPNSRSWSNWTNHGGAIRPPLSVGRNLNGRLEVFAVDAGGSTAKHIWQTDVDAGWSDWSDMGGTLEPGLTVVRNADGRLELFGIDSRDKTLVHCWQLHPNGTDDWSEWSSLGSSMLPGFAVGQNLLGRLEVFAVNGKGEMDRICQRSADDSAHWSSWLNFGGNVRPGIAVGQSADGRIEVFAVEDKHATLLHRWETLSDGSDHWSAWTSMERSAQPYPAAGQNEDGNLEVFAVDKDNSGTINHRRQIGKASSWLDWSSLDHSTFQYNSRTWQTDEGLPHNLVQAITQSRDGSLWVGTLEGLARFDGVFFTPFNARNTPEIKNSSITALCADRQGALWIGTDGGGLVRLKEGAFSRFDKTNGLAGNVLSAIYESKDGSLWIGTTSGMSRWQNGKFINYTRKEGLLSDIVRSIYEDRDGNLWIATGAGLNRLKGETMDSFAMPNGLPDDSVRAICQDKGGRIWIGSNNGMLWYNPYWSKSFYAYNTKYGLSDTFVSAICEDQEGNLWAGTYSGLNRFREGRFFTELNNEGMAFDRVNALFEDREGNLWVGSKEGLARLTPKRFFAYTKQQGLTHNNIMSVREDRSGSLWIGTWGGGLNQLKGDRVTAYATTNGLSRDLILSTGEGRDGSLWIGEDFDGGLTHLKDGKFSHYTWKDGLINAGLRVIHEDASGNLWIGTSEGVSRLKDGKFTNYTVKDNLAGNVVRAICEDQTGNLWFGTEGGLSCWTNGQFTSFTTQDGLSDDTVIALYPDAAKNLWIGTGSGGLNRYRDGRFTAYTTQQGLFSDQIFEILEDNQGWLWMSCSKGVFRVRKRDLDAIDKGKTTMIGSIAYGKTDGMESTECNGAAKPGGWKARDGRLWFPTSKGLVGVDPKAIKIEATPPPVYIEELIADRKPLLRGGLLIRTGSRGGAPDSPVHGSPDSPVRIPPGRGELEFHYTALSLSAPEKNRFRYKLQGIDSEWVDAGTRRTAYYNSINPGRYRFRVVACNKDGIWNEVGDSLAIVFLPHYWQTWWFRGLTALLVIGTAGGTALYLARKRLQRKLQLLEQRHAIEKERARIAKDMHDQLGVGLTQVGLLGELAKRDAHKPEQTRVLAGKICEVAREQAQTLDEIVWTVNPKNDSLNKLAAYMAVYAEEVFRLSAIRCRLDIPSGLPPWPLSAEVRHNLFLTVKEALNNAMKHAGASEVWLRFSLAHSVLEIVIEDTGKGFSVETAEQFGNGLSNMKERTEEIGGQFRLTSELNKGTRIHLKVPLKGASQDN